MADILITEFMDTAAVEALAAEFETDYQPDLVNHPERIAGSLSKARALIVRNRTQVTEALVAAAPELACVGRLGVGLDNIDLSACAARGVEVFPATGANNLSVVEYVLATAMMLLRRAYQRNDEMIAGKWPRTAASGREISGRILGLVGFGAIAQDLAVKARALGMEIVAHDPFLPAGHPAWEGARSVELSELYAVSDVVSLHVPLTDGTRHLVNADAIGRMRDDAVLINAARGGVVDEEALVSALKSGHLSGAALDVFETEPLTGEAGALFQDVPNLVLTPHIGGVTEESNTRVSALIAERVAAHLR